MKTPHLVRPDRRRPLAVAGEELAALHLQRRGLCLLTRNWRCDLGELDLVLLDGDELVVVEVKTRRTEAFGHPLAAIDHRKAARLRRLAVRFAQESDRSYGGLRVDAVGIVWPRGGDPILRHVEAVGR